MDRSECHITTGCNISVTSNAAPWHGDHQAGYQGSGPDQRRAVTQSQKGSFTRNHKMMFAAINKLFKIGTKLTSIVNELRVEFHFTSDWKCHPAPARRVNCDCLQKWNIFEKLSPELFFKCQKYCSLHFPAWQHDVAFDQNVGVRRDGLWRDPRDILRHTSMLSRECFSLGG